MEEEETKSNKEIESESDPESDNQMDDVQEDKEPNPEDPTEAISIIFDTSGSMKKNFVE